MEHIALDPKGQKENFNTNWIVTDSDSEQKRRERRKKERKFNNH